MRLSSPLLVLLTTVALAGVVEPVHAQVTDDVVMLGRHYGTEPPAAYFELRDRRPGAFEFERAWFGRRPDRDRGGDADTFGTVAGGGADWTAGTLTPNRIFGNYDGAVEGTFRFPLLLGYYADDASAPGYGVGTVQEQFFSGPNPTGTVRDYYLAASGDRVELLGETMDWRGSSLTRAEVTGGNSGLGGGSRVGEFIIELIAHHDDGSVDWGVYDNDGPDGVPNSGDDDGYVDVLTVMHPTQGAECGGSDNDDRIWSHRWSLGSSTGASYVTQSPGTNGGFIRINDYTIQPLLECSGQGINHIGVFAHELGHGFGLPDLYATGSSNHSGIGTWGLMGSGSWGCANTNPARPCMPSAWTREAMGWGAFVDLPPDADLTGTTFHSPVDGGAIYRYRVPGSRTYFLLEHRDLVGFDSDIRSPGLLVWQIEPDAIDAPGGVNSNPDAMGVWLRQADGLNHLALAQGGNRGDSGDPFPGSTGATAFHAATTPSSHLLSGPAAALTILDVAAVGSSTTARVITGRTQVTVRSEGGADGSTLTVNDTEGGSEVVGEWAPFETLDLTASGGELEAPGTRSGFEGWSDGVTTRTRDFEVPPEDVELVATFGSVEYLVSSTLLGGVNGVAPGQVVSDPAAGDFWFPAGVPVTFTAHADPGFVFQSWGGDLTDETNPVSVTVDGPMSIAAQFQSTYSVSGSLDVPVAAGDELDLQLQVSGAQGGATWTVVDGTLPPGVVLSSASGRVHGFALGTGTFEFRVRATDSRGLNGDAHLTLVVDAPDLPVATLATRFLGSGPTLTTGQLLWLDRAGNDNGGYDLGDAVLYLRRGGGSVAAADRKIEMLLHTGMIGGAR